MSSVWLHRYAVAVAVCTFFLIIAGASVTSNEAGLSVPDWPLSYGQVMPEMKGGVFFEHGHRMVASAVGFLTIILAVWLWRADDRAWMRRLGWAALAAVIAQGVLGGLTVIYLLPKAVSIAHACLAQIFFSTTVAIVIFTSRSWRQGPVLVEDAGTPSLRTLALLTPAAVLAQVALGAAFRHRALSVLPHVYGAVVVTVVILMTAVFVIVQAGAHRDLARAASALIGITTLQVVLGVVAYAYRASHAGDVPGAMLVLFTVAHVAMGALTTASSFALTIQVLRNVRPRLMDTARLRPVSG